MNALDGIDDDLVCPSGPGANLGKETVEEMNTRDLVKEANNDIAK
jgi:hypothetical protein